MSEGTCAACRRSIDAAAKLCPYCGANPATGERIDTQAILQQIFRPKDMSKSESVLEYARQRQGIVVVVSLIVGFLVLAGIHQFVTMRNANAVTDAPAVPLTEIVDSTNRAAAARPVPMPNLDFQYSGRPQAMRTFIAERGAVAPAPPPAATTTQPGAQPAPGAAQPAPAQPGAQSGTQPAPGAARPQPQATPARPPQPR